MRSRRDLRDFVRLPHRIYAGDPHWVAPLEISFRAEIDPGRNPFFRHARAEYLLAFRGRECVGRIAAIVNDLHNRQHGDRTGFWGWFESAPDPEVASALLRRAGEELAARDRDSMRGPFNPSINGPCGMLVEGFDTRPVALMPYNPPGYPGLVEAAGQTKLLDLLALHVRREDFAPDHPPVVKVRRLADAVRRRRPEITYRSLDMSRYEEDTARLNSLFNEARQRNWGFVPVTDEEFAAQAREMRPFVNPDIIVIAEHGGEAIACLIGIPDVNALLAPCRGRLLPFGWLRILWNRRKVRRVRVFGAATREEYRNSGVTAVLFDQIIENCRRIGVTGGEVSWVAESNLKSLGTIQSAFGIEPYKRYRVYHRALAPGGAD